MEYVFFETQDMSIIQRKFLNEKYQKYINFEEIMVYEFLIRQCVTLNTKFSIDNIKFSLGFESDKIKLIFRKLIDVKLLNIYKGEVYVFELLPVRINSEYYNLDFVKDISPIDYGNYEKLDSMKNNGDNQKYINFDILSLLLRASNIVLNEKDKEYLNSFNRVHNLDIPSIVNIVKKTYNINSKCLNHDKISFTVNKNLTRAVNLPNNLHTFIKKASNGLFAQKDLDVFTKLLNKHTNLNDEQIKAIITFVYKTQKNIYFNFVDKLAISIQKESKLNYSIALEYLEEQFKKSKSYSGKYVKKEVKVNAKKESQVVNLNELNRVKAEGVGVSIDDILGSDDR